MNSNVNIDQALTVEGVHSWFIAHGFPYSLRQVRTMFNERRLPVWKGPDQKRLFVWKSRLEETIISLGTVSHIPAANGSYTDGGRDKHTTH